MFNESIVPAKNWRRVLLLGLFFGFIALSLLSPLASNVLMPQANDFAAHTGLIVQAKMALAEGQFPIRIAPWQFNGWRYPVFQFYASFSHTIAAVIYMFITPANPYLAFKITIWLALTLAGIYIYRLVYQITNSSINGLLSAIVYMSAPYILINISARGDFGEVIAQGIIPVVLFYTFQMVRIPGVRNFCLVSLTYSILAITHTITFVYTSLFIGLFLIFMLFIKEIDFSPRKLLLLGLAYGYSILLVMWFVAPVVLVEQYLAIDRSLNTAGIAWTNWLTSISSLLSVAAVSPIPLPAFGYDFPFFLDFAIGWPILLAVGTGFYICISRTKLEKKIYINKLYSILLILFLFSLFIIWTPFDFWSYLPKHLAIAQFSYRLLSQLMWIGTLLFAFALAWLFEDKLDKRYLITGILLIGLSSGSWLHSNPSSKISISSLIDNPDMNYGRYDYLVKPDITANNFSIPQITQPITQVQNSCRLNGTITTCSITATQAGFVQLPILYYPGLLDIKVNGHSVDYVPLEVENNALPPDMADGLTQGLRLFLSGVELQSGTNEISAQFVGFVWANWISRISWFGLICLFIYSIVKRRKNM